MGPLALVLLGTVGAGVAYEYARKHPGSAPRRRTTGKSGTVWFTQGGPGSSSGSTRTTVFASERGDDAVLMFEQTGSDKATRKLVFQAPATLGATAKKDFLG